MKVLHVIPAVAPRYGGPSEAVFGAGRALRQQGIDVLVATTDADGTGHLPTVLGTPRESQGVPVIFFRRQWSEGFKYSRALAGWLDRHVAEFSVVHIYAVFSHACLAASAACWRHDVPYVVCPHGSLDPWSLRQKPLRKQMVWRLGARRMLAEAAAVQYSTRAEQRLAEGPLGLSRGVAIPLGIDLPTYAATADVAAFRARQPGLGNHPYVLALGRIHPKKGLELLLDAFARGARSGSPPLRDWRLVVAGDGDNAYVASLKRLADQQAPGRVVFTGWVEGEQKVAALQGAGLLALPSYQESFGLVVAEAMACGVPVLVSADVNLAEDIQAGGAGWVVPLDPRALEHSLADALGRDEERRRRGAAGRLLAAQFNWSRVAVQLRHLYESVVCSQRAAGWKLGA